MSPDGYNNIQGYKLEGVPMKALQNSYIYHLYLLLRRWFARQWDGSLLVEFMTSQKTALPENVLVCSGARKVRSCLMTLCEKLKLGKFLEGSIFLHPEWFAAAAVILAPLLPTMAVLALVCAGFFSLVLKLGLERDMHITATPLNGYVLLYAGLEISGQQISKKRSVCFPVLFVMLQCVGSHRLCTAGYEQSASGCRHNRRSVCRHRCRHSGKKRRCMRR